MLLCMLQLHKWSLYTSHMGQKRLQWCMANNAVGEKHHSKSFFFLRCHCIVRPPSRSFCTMWLCRHLVQGAHSWYCLQIGHRINQNRNGATWGQWQFTPAPPGSYVQGSLHKKYSTVFDEPWSFPWASLHEFRNVVKIFFFFSVPDVPDIFSNNEQKS